MKGIALPKTFALLLLPLLPLTGAGCYGTVEGDGDPGPLGRGLPIVSISRELPADMLAKRTAALTASGPIERKVSALQGPESFYLAINRNDLGKKFFFTAFSKADDPRGVEGGAASSLGTRVVTFRVQNNKLFMFDVRDNRNTSDAFDPAYVLEAYPLVTGFQPFKVLPGNDNYVLFDPAAGLNRFHPIVSDSVEPGEPTWQFKVDLSYMQAFRQASDGATFEQVFTGTINDAKNTFPRQWGTLGVAIRRYSEGPGFEPLLASEELPAHYFPDEPQRELNTGALFAYYARWNSRAGQKPIEWIISDRWLQLAKDHPKYDWIGVVKAGVEGWNAAFGYQALTTRMATPDDSFAQDDKNFIILDRDPSLGYAFANMRMNPNTAEIRGASVYVGGAFIEGAMGLFDPPAATKPPTMARPTPPAAGKAVGFAWSNLQPRTLCRRPLSRAEVGGALADVEGLTPKQRVEAFITHVVLHEVGHTLGLGHNFMGSLDPVQTSSMEYLVDEESHLRVTPGPYDVDAIKYLYGLAQEPPKQRFCSDAEVAKDPMCGMFDTSDDPLGKYWAPMYQKGTAAVLRMQEPERVGLNNLAGFLRKGSPPDQARAWEALREPFKIGQDVTMNEVAYPGYTERLNLIQEVVLERLFFDKKEQRGEIVDDPEIEGPALAVFTGDLKNTITNSDKIRSWTVRRRSVDVLKKMQVQPAYQALLDARDALVAGRPGLPSIEEVSLTDDLIARVERAIRPYFEK
jgi:hypothetical protein